MPRVPHKLELYLHAVQHPPAEVAFFHRAYRRYFGAAAAPTRLREDFAGTAAIAAEWVAQGEDHRALAVDTSEATLRWAARHARRVLGERRFADLHLVRGDAAAFPGPRVDVVAATNFSVFACHSRAALLRYLRHAAGRLAERGVLVLDAFGGPGAMSPGEQARSVEGPDGRVFEYVWEQRAFDHLTHRIDCRIHFRGLPGGAERTNAFRYDWRLWSLPELLELMAEAGFDEAEAWCDARGVGGWDGRYRPVRRLPARRDWVAYVVGVRRRGARRSAAATVRTGATTRP